MSEMRLALVRVSAVLRSRIHMTCGLGECLEEHEVATGSSSFVLSEAKDENVMSGREFFLDLPESTLTVPQGATYTVTSWSTGRTFEIIYEVEVRVRAFEHLGDGRQREIGLKKTEFPVMVGSCEILEEERRVIVRARGMERFRVKEGEGEEDEETERLPMYNN